MDKQQIIRLRSMPYEQYLKTPEWAEKREKVLSRDGHRCRACNSEENLQVHHRTYMRRGHEDLNDLTTLCGPCHEHFHQKISQDEIMLRTYAPPDDPALREERKLASERKWEDYLIGLLITQPDLYPYVRGLLSEDDFISADAGSLYVLMDTLTLSSKLTEQDVPESLRDAVSRANKVMEARPMQGDPKDAVDLMHCAARIKRQRLLRSNEDLKHRIREATDAGDSETLKQLQYQLVGVYQQLRTIDTAMHMEK